MVLEIALIDVAAGTEDEFSAAYRSVRHVLVAAAGSEQAVTMRQGVESPARFVLTIEWESIAAHEAFRAADSFSVWRAAVGPLFASPPVVEHFVEV